MNTEVLVVCCSEALRCLLIQCAKEESNDVRKAIVVAQQSGKGYKVVFKQI